MAKKIMIWADDMLMVKSERSYDIYSLPAAKVVEDSRGEFIADVRLTLYVDTQTGIVTTDVSLYERSLNND